MDAASSWTPTTTELRPTPAAPTQVCATDLTALGDFAVVADPAVLPVELTRFTATRDGAAVRLA